MILVSPIPFLYLDQIGQLFYPGGEPRYTCAKLQFFAIIFI